jgi:hypothetical protein
VLGLVDVPVPPPAVPVVLVVASAELVGAVVLERLLNDKSIMRPATVLIAAKKTRRIGGPPCRGLELE